MGIRNKSDIAAGDLIEQRYRVIAPIGAGGMGTLYRVADVGRGSDEVALKMVKLNLAGISAEELLRQFQREFQLLTQLQHPNLVQVYNYGATAGGDFFYTMEYIAGRDLAKGMQGMDLEELLPIMVQICRALGYLHAREVMHGDLKPANVLLSGAQVKIVDFGLAHDLRFEGDSPAYITPFYAAPEVGKGRSVDGRADLYSLGAMLYEGIVGETPAFMVGAERLIRMTLRERLASQTSIPAGIDEVVRRLLAKDPHQRYSSANQVIAALNLTTSSTYELETRETASSYALRARFLGRDSELDQLRDIWKQAKVGQAGLMLIGGESGVGKTRLVEELEVEVELSGARVIWGQCLEIGGSAYQPWREVLRVLLRYVESVESLDLKRVGPVLGAIMPELWSRPYMVGLSPPAELEPQAAQQRLNDAILQVLRIAAQTRPTLVVIDDAHWGDEASLEMVRYLGRVLGNHGLLVCVTYRSDEVAKAISEVDTDAHMLVELDGEPVERILLETLPAEETQQLVRSMLGLAELPAELMQRVQDTTSGNTFFVQELIRSLAEEGQVLQRTVAGWQVDQTALQTAQLPGSIQQVVWRRLEQLSEAARQVLSYAAVVGTLFWEGAIAQVGGTVAGADWVRAALSEALERELVVLRDETTFAGEREYLFAKPAMREVSYESLEQEPRRESHARVADWLMKRPDEQIDEHLGLIAEHLQGAGQIEQAVIYLRRAGEQAAAQFANAQASSFFSRALDLASTEDQAGRYTLLLAREKVYDLLGAREPQDQDLAALMDLAKILDKYSTQPEAAVHVRQSQVALRQANYYEATGDFPAAITMAQEAVRLAQEDQDVGNQSAGLVKWGEALFRQSEFDAARGQLERALGLARSAGLRQVEADSLNHLGTVYWMEGDCAEAKIYYQQALHIYRQLDNPQGESQALNNFGIACADQGDKAEGRAYFEQSLRICRQVGDRNAEAMMLHNFALACLDLGVYTEARASFEQALRIQRQTAYPVGESKTMGALGQLCRLLGDFESARRYNQQALRIAREIGSHHQLAIGMNSLGHDLFGLGRLEQAGQAYQQALSLGRRIFEEYDEHSLIVEPQASLARVALAQGNLEQALALVEQFLNQLELGMLTTAREPFWVYLSCYHVLRANQDARSESILSSAYHLLQEQAARISDEEMRYSYLENVVTHKEIINEYEQRNASLK